MNASVETIVRDNLELFGKKVVLVDTNDDQLQPYIGQVGEVRGVEEDALIVRFGNTELTLWDGFDQYAFL